MKKEWLNEPDVKVFSYLDFVCVIVRHPEMLNLCGYVFIPPEHPLYGKSDEETDLLVHGGVTYAGHYQGEKSAWAVGFDCAHGGDIVPLIQKMHTATNIPSTFYDRDSTYKNIEYVESELKQLVDQILEKYTSDEMKQSLKTTLDSRFAKALLVKWNEER